MRIPDKFIPRLQRDQVGKTTSSHHTGFYAEVLEVEVHPLGRIWAKEEQLLAVASIKVPQFLRRCTPESSALKACSQTCI